MKYTPKVYTMQGRWADGRPMIGQIVAISQGNAISKTIGRYPGTEVLLIAETSFIAVLLSLFVPWAHFGGPDK